MEKQINQNSEIGKTSTIHYYRKKDRLPLEEMDPDFYTPKDIAQIIGTLYKDLCFMEQYAIKINRFSDDYRTVSRGLEGILRKKGSLLITKAVFEQQGDQVPVPEDLTISRLYLTANYHFNKVHAAITGIQLQDPKLYIALVAQEIRWATLLERLDATEQKIEYIREGKTVIRKKNRKAPKPAGKPGAESSSASVNTSGPSALPVISELLPDNGQDQEPGARTTAAATVFTETEETVPAVTPEPEANDTEAAETGEADAGSAGDEKMMRDILLGAAVIMGNRKLYEMIAAIEDGELRSVWDDFLREEAENGYPILTIIRERNGDPYAPPQDEEQPIPLDEVCIPEPAYCL